MISVDKSYLIDDESDNDGYDSGSSGTCTSLFSLNILLVVLTNPLVIFIIPLVVLTTPFVVFVESVMEFLFTFLTLRFAIIDIS